MSRRDAGRAARRRGAAALVCGVALLTLACGATAPVVATSPSDAAPPDRLTPFESETALDDFIASLRTRADARPPVIVERGNSMRVAPQPTIQALPMGPGEILLAQGCRLFALRVTVDAVAVEGPFDVGPPGARCSPVRREGSSVLAAVARFEEGRFEVVRLTQDQATWRVVDVVELRLPREHIAMLGAGATLYAGFPVAPTIEWPAMRENGHSAWRRIPAASELERAPGGGTWLHLVVACAAPEGRLSCRSHGILGPEGMTSVSERAVYVAGSSGRRTRLLRLDADGAGEVELDGIPNGDAFDVIEAGAVARTLLVHLGADGLPTHPLLAEIPFDAFRPRARFFEGVRALPAFDPPDALRGLSVLLAPEVLGVSTRLRGGGLVSVIHRDGRTTIRDGLSLRRVLASGPDVLAQWEQGGATLFTAEGDELAVPLAPGEELAVGGLPHGLFATAIGTRLVLRRRERSAVVTWGEIELGGTVTPDEVAVLALEPSALVYAAGALLRIGESLGIVTVGRVEVPNARGNLDGS